MGAEAEGEGDVGVGEAGGAEEMGGAAAFGGVEAGTAGGPGTGTEGGPVEADGGEEGVHLGLSADQGRKDHSRGSPVRGS